MVSPNRLVVLVGPPGQIRLQPRLVRVMGHLGRTRVRAHLSSAGDAFGPNTLPIPPCKLGPSSRTRSCLVSLTAPSDKEKLLPSKPVSTFGSKKLLSCKSRLRTPCKPGGTFGSKKAYDPPYGQRGGASGPNTLGAPPCRFVGLSGPSGQTNIHL